MRYPFSQWGVGLGSTDRISPQSVVLRKTHEGFTSHPRRDEETTGQVVLNLFIKELFYEKYSLSYVKRYVKNTYMFPYRHHSPPFKIRIYK